MLASSSMDHITYFENGTCVEDFIGEFGPQKTCPLCCDKSFETCAKAEAHIRTSHVNYLVNFSKKGRKGVILPCRRNCIKRQGSAAIRSHYHCPDCGKILGRRTSLQEHLLAKPPKFRGTIESTPPTKRGKSDSQEGRLRVALDTQTGEWSCQCPNSGTNKACLHEAIAKWYVKQHQANLTSNVTSLQIDITDDMAFAMNYLIDSKRIPVDLPASLLGDKCPSEPLQPPENTCPRCNGNISVSVVKNACLYGMGHVWPNVAIKSKKCEQCQLDVKFQDFRTGVHNFDNHVMLTLRLCMHLLCGIENHLSVEGSLKSLFPGKTVPFSTLRNGFLHFLALQEHSYSFQCVKCGENPKLVIGDGNWKNSCVQPVDATKKSPNTKDIIHVDEVWTSYQKEILGRAFYGPARNPWKVKIDYKSVAPWMSTASRLSQKLYNTEHRKGAIFEEPPAMPLKDCPVTQDSILMALNDSKTTTEDFKNLCRSLGINASGSQQDLINKINELILFKKIEPKMYKKIQKCGGGIVHLRCEHGVCLYFKYILRQESARDYVDALLSFKERPRVIISDIASQVGHHSECRVPGLFAPYKGMLYPYTEENIKKHESGTLPPVALDLAKVPGTYYSLNDRFHQKSKKGTPEKSFRDLKNCPDLYSINTSVAEQQNAVMARDRYSFCSMNPVNFMFLTRSCLHLNNLRLNQQYLRKTKKRFSHEIMYTDQGQATLNIRCRRLVETEIQCDKTNEEHRSDVESQAQGGVDFSNIQNVEETLSGVSVAVPDKTGEGRALLPRVTENVESVSQSVLLEEPTSAKDKLGLSPDIDDLWLSLHENRVEAAFGDWHIDKRSLCLLRGSTWLDDEIVDRSLSAFVSQFSAATEVMCTHLASQWFYKGKYPREPSRSRRLTNNILLADVVAAINVGQHWILMASNIATRELFVYDPLGNERIYCGTLLRHWRSFRKTFSEEFYGWSTAIVEHPLQMDSNNCGILILKAAEQYLMGKRHSACLQFDHTTSACDGYRKDIGNFLLGLTDPSILDNYCTVCNGIDPVKGGDMWVACDQCGRWTHNDCLQSPSPRESFFCMHCVTLK